MPSRRISVTRPERRRFGGRGDRARRGGAPRRHQTAAPTITAARVSSWSVIIGIPRWMGAERARTLGAASGRSRRTRFTDPPEAGRARRFEPGDRDGDAVLAEVAVQPCGGSCRHRRGGCCSPRSRLGRSRCRRPRRRGNAGGRRIADPPIAGGRICGHRSRRNRSRASRSSPGEGCARTAWRSWRWPLGLTELVGFERRRRRRCSRGPCGASCARRPLLHHLGGRLARALRGRGVAAIRVGRRRAVVSIEDAAIGGPRDAVIVIVIAVPKRRTQAPSLALLFDQGARARRFDAPGLRGPWRSGLLCRPGRVWGPPSRSTIQIWTSVFGSLPVGPASSATCRCCRPWRCTRRSAPASA